MNRLLKFLLFTILLLVTINTVQWLIFNLVGFNPVPFSLLPIIVIFLIPCLFLSARYINGGIEIPFEVIIFSCLVCFLFVYGYIAGNKIDIILTEVWTFLLITFFFIMGRGSKVWEAIHIPALITFWISFVLMIVATSFLRQHLVGIGFDETQETRKTYTLAYDFIILIEIWPLIFFLGLIRTKQDLIKYLSYATFLAYLLAMIYFEKRAPMARALLYFIGLIFFTKFIPYRVKSENVLISVFFIFGGVLLMPFFLETQFGNRFVEGDYYARFIELKMAFRDFSLLEWIFGRGLGGFYEPDSYSEYRFVSYVASSTGAIGKAATHIGLAYPILKGGLLLFTIIFFQILRLPIRFLDTEWMQDPMNRFAIIFLAVYCITRIIEGPLTPGAAYEAIMFGLCMGRISLQPIKAGGSTKIAA